jgi:hypothetical protein
MKCEIPSFVTDFVSVINWSDNNAAEFYFSQNTMDGKYVVLPSGELQIRNVSPEDGFKTYKCRTKHRLTGETKLSATAGRLVITEPIGGAKPKFSIGTEKLAFTRNENQQIGLLCPAQGFPLPAFRWYKFMETTKNKKTSSLR